MNRLAPSAMNSTSLAAESPAFEQACEIVHEKYSMCLNSLREGLSRCSWRDAGGGTVCAFLRNDSESGIETPLHAHSFDISRIAVGSWIDRGITALFSAMFLTGVNAADIVITDRLHVGIAAAVLGKTVFLIDNSYGKVRGVYNRLFANSPKVRLIEDVSDLPFAFDEHRFQASVPDLERIAYSCPEFRVSYQRGLGSEGRPAPGSLKVTAAEESLWGVRRSAQ
jgi:hypothetical protein